MSDKTWFESLPKYYQRQLRRKGATKFALGRREVLKGAGAAIAGAAAEPLFSSRAAAAARLNYMCWDGYQDARIVESFNEARTLPTNEPGAHRA